MSDISLPENVSLSPPCDDKPAHLCVDSTKLPLDSTSVAQHNKGQQSASRCLIVGRQAAVVDIRIDHKSISRKHALLFYYDNKVGIMHVGGKHGTSVNQKRIPDQTIVELRDGDMIQFGNSTEKIFQLSWPQINDERPKQSERTQQTGIESNFTKDPLEGLTGRARREAEIAAMMATLDETPTYDKVEPTSIPIKEEDSNECPQNDFIVQLTNHHKLPLSHHVEFEHVQTKSVTALAMDSAGSRLLSGSNDYSIQMYDFGGMDAHHRPFGELQLSSTESDLGQFPIVDISYSPTGDKFVVATTSACCRVFDRDGHDM